MMTPSAERAQMPVADILRGKRDGQRVTVELRRRSRARERSHIYYHCDINLPQKRHELS